VAQTGTKSDVTKISANRFSKQVSRAEIGYSNHVAVNIASAVVTLLSV
jgi:hypothetical protein